MYKTYYDDRMYDFSCHYYVAVFYDIALFSERIEFINSKPDKVFDQKVYGLAKKIDSCCAACVCIRTCSIFGKIFL